MGGWQTKFSVSPGPGLWSLVLGPFGPDLGPDLDLTWDLDLDLSLTIFMLHSLFIDVLQNMLNNGTTLYLNCVISMLSIYFEEFV